MGDFEKLFSGRYGIETTDNRNKLGRIYNPETVRNMAS
jgi:hypothetical protein